MVKHLNSIWRSGLWLVENIVDNNIVSWSCARYVVERIDNDIWLLDHHSFQLNIWNEIIAWHQTFYSHISMKMRCIALKLAMPGWQSIFFTFRMSIFSFRTPSQTPSRIISSLSVVTVSAPVSSCALPCPAGLQPGSIQLITSEGRCVPRVGA